MIQCRQVILMSQLQSNHHQLGCAPKQQGAVFPLRLLGPAPQAAMSVLQPSCTLAHLIEASCAAGVLVPHP
jgi:hypothetical protein